MSSPEYAGVNIGAYRIEAHSTEVLVDQRFNTVSVVECAIWKQAHGSEDRSNFVEVMSYENTSVTSALIRFARYCLNKYDLTNEDNPHIR